MHPALLSFISNKEGRLLSVASTDAVSDIVFDIYYNYFEYIPKDKIEQGNRTYNSLNQDADSQESNENDTENISSNRTLNWQNRIKMDRNTTEDIEKLAIDRR